MCVISNGADEEILTNSQEDADIDVATARLIREAFARGQRQGFKDGFVEGFESGFQKGYQDGFEDARCGRRRNIPNGFVVRNQCNSNSNFRLNLNNNFDFRDFEISTGCNNGLPPAESPVDSNLEAIRRAAFNEGFRKGCCVCTSCCRS